MDNAEKSSRGPSKGIFDTASLLAQPSTIFSSQSPSPAPLSHLAHSPSAFSVLGRTAVLVPPPSSNSDSPSLPTSSKICSPVIHQSASDALSSLASSSGPCGWWSASTPVATTAEFPGCGVSSLNDHYGRAGICGRSPISLGSSTHLPIPQPRRIVEEVLGHLYAKPPSAEVKAELQSSGIHGSHQVSCKTPTLSSVNLQDSPPKNSSKLKPNSFSEKEANSGKSQDKSKTVVNNVAANFPVNSTASGNGLSRSPSKKSSGVSGELNADSSVLSQSANSTTRSKKRLRNCNKNDKKNKESSKSKAPINRKSKEKKIPKKLSSDSESHADSTGGSSSSGGESGSSGVVSTSDSSDSSDEEVREKQQKELERLKKQQQELRRKVQELKQASQDSSHQKTDTHVKKTIASKSPVTGNTVNKVTKPVPSPAHSASVRSLSPKTVSPKLKSSGAHTSEDDVNMSVPLDLCMKKQEPTFEVTNSSLPTSFNSTNMLKNQVTTSTGNSSSNLKTPTVGKRRGRKPKSAISPVGSGLEPNLIHHLKQNMTKEHSLQIPHKLLVMPSENASNSLSSHKKSGSSTASSKGLCFSSSILDPFSTPRKDFTLDSLLSETNGTIDIMPSKVGSDMQTLSSSSFSSKVTKSKERLRQNNRMKRSETKSRELETPEKNDSSSETDSEPDNEYSDTDDTEKSASGSTVDNIPSVSGHGHKRSLDEDNEDSTTKRRRILPDEKDIQIPLEHGWRRQTKIRCFSRSGVRGEVAYYAPCGKKLRNYPEVIRYLIKHGISDINRENFSFSTKINVGEFLESTSSGSGEDYVLLSEQEVIARIDEVRARKGRLGVQVRKSHQRSAEEDEQQRLWEQKQLQHQLEQQELSQRAQDLKMVRRMKRERAFKAATAGKKQTAEEARRQKEHQRLLKQQERFERIEHMRIEREIRAQQLLEEQEMKRQQAVFLREQEMQKRREMLLMVDLERERRRQHMILVRALEARKKQEERERKREEILYEKRMNKEKKLEQRRMELDYLRELKKPVEDMLLKDSEPLLTLNRIPGVKLCGKAFGNMLMVFEFLHNFGETLGFDTDSLPSLNTMQMAILNSDEKCEEELLSVIHHLLVCAIDDPGVPHCPEASTVLGQNLKDADITNNNVSEVLKLYFIAHDKRSKMCLWLQEKPFLSLNPTQKTEILAFLCNELLCSRLLVRQIDNNIENVNVLRKDKWVIEGDLRKMKMIQQRRALKMKQCNEDSKGDHPLADETEIGEGASNSAPVNSEKDSQASDMQHDDNGGKDSIKTEKEKYEELENEVANESGNESDDTQATGQVSDGEDDDLHLSNEELAKKVDKLTKQLNAFSAKLVKACHTLRGVTFGQDRYHRRYWVLPKSGGIFAESMESSVFAFDQKLIASDIKTEISMPVNDVEKSVLLKTDMDANCVKQEVEACKTVEVQETQSKHDGTSDESKDVCVKTELDNQEHQPLLQLNPDVSVDTKDPKDDNIMDGKSDTIEIQLCEDTEQKEEKKTNVNIFMPKFCDSTLGLDAISPINNSLHNKSDKKHASNPSIPADQNWLLHSPFFASLLAGNMLFNGPMMSGRDVNGTYFNLPKNDSNNPFGPFLGLQPGIMSPENLFKSLGEKSNNSKPWFSILPRMPCDENSLIHNQLSKNSITPVSNSTGNTPNTSSPSKPTSHMSHSTPVSAASSHLAPSALANMQMELLNGMPSGFFMHPFMMPQFGPTYQNNSPVTCASHQTSFTSTLSTSNPTTDFNLNLTHPPAASTPSSIPTPSATPGPTCLDSNSFFLRDSPSPSFAKRLLMEKMAQEYDKPQEIPLELQKGWWRITDPGQLKTLLNALHHRGIREKMLQKQLQKHFNYACNACSQGQNEDTDLEITDIDREISQMPGGAPVLDCDETWYPEVALRVDIAILEQVENLEEKVGGASMQIKGWKPPPKLSCESLSKFVPACEKFLLQKGSQEIFGSLSEKSTHKTKSSSKKKSGKKHKGGKGDKSTDSSPIKSADPILINEKIEIADDSESKTQIIAEEQSKEESEEPHDPTADKINPVEEAKKRLLMVEAAIERRYLKPPLGVNPKDLNLSTISNNGSSSQSPAESDDEIHVPPGLLKWREAVKKCRTSSQLAMCLNFLENFTAWDKSIMRASCQFCHSGDNEDMLLLCDGCDKGYHTYCFKPKMETIPDGDWYCYECLNKATGDNVCVICGRKGKLLECETCPKTFHHTCLEPPLAKMPKGKWHCSGCNLNKPKKNVKKNSNNSSSCSSSSSNSSGKEKDTSKETKDISGNKKTENSQPSKSKGTEKKDKKEKGRGNTDLAPCSIIVDELEKHDDAWPFLLPVNTKQFPTYRKVIKKPMDISTMRSKLEASTYKSREEFAVDARLIFDNCETFNEDDSPVGQAGHSIRAFFETRWAELCGT